MCKESILWHAHWVYNTAHTIVVSRAAVSLCVAEDNLHTTTIYLCSAAWTLQPVFIPACNHFLCKLILVVVVCVSRCVAIERTVAFLVVRIAPWVPVPAESLVAAVFHHPHRLGVALVYVEHLASILSLWTVKHLTAADGAHAMWVVHVAYLLHWYHVVFRYSLVSALVEQDTWIIAEVDDGIAHQLLTLLPAASFNIFLCVTSWHSLDKTNAVAWLHILTPWSYVHPAHNITSTLYLQVVRIVAQPCRHAHAHTRPLVAGALCIAMHHHHAVVKVNHTILKLCLAETSLSNNLVALNLSFHII